MNTICILLIVFIFILFNVTKNYNVNIIYFKHNIIIQSFNWNKKSNLRKLYWEEKVKFHKDNHPEEDSIKHCETSYSTDYKYNIFYEVGKDYTELETNLQDLVEKNIYYPVSNIFKEEKFKLNQIQSLLFNEIKDAATKNDDHSDWGNYFREIGLFFFFVGCAGVSIVVLIFNWICWLNQCCCCDFLHNPINKRIAWWTSFIFLLGVLACCISGFVTVNRFGFALEGSRCAFDRNYYDALYGQLKNSEPRWEGIKFIEENCGSNIPSYVPNEKNFESIQNATIFMDYFHEKEDTLKRSLNILAMSYFCLFLIAVVSAEVSMMFYACLKRQGYLITLMHVLWNIIRFFIFSFFLYGTAYGIIFNILSDLIGAMKMIFEENLSDENNPATYFLKGCLSLKFQGNENTLFSEYKKNVKACLSNFECAEAIGNQQICKRKLDQNKEEFFNLDCSFLKSDLNHLYKALNDASLESQKLSAISLCSAFFGAVAIYFYLLVMHHYNNELFFDSGKSIFTGFDGFGKGYKNKNRNNDPAYKKRKLRAEIELTSKNDEQNEYKDINKNDDD